MHIRLVAAAIALSLPAPALAADDYLEGWFEGTVSKDIGGGSFVEFQTQQRARGSSNPTGDNQTYRLWLGHKFGGVEGSVGIHRSKEGSTRETRLIQQASYGLGVSGLKGRTRVEQRFVDDTGRTGWRVRQRVGFAVPLANTGGWELAGNAEGFLTLRATSAGGDTGLTGLRTYLGFERSFGSVDVGLGYTRNQSIRKRGPDRVGHAPTLSLTLNL